MGTELQDQKRAVYLEFKNLKRSRGVSGAEYVADFERSLEKAESHGVGLNNVLKSALTPERCIF